MGEGKQDIRETTAPSVGPNTVIEKESPQERLARGNPSGTDAMGLDKRRGVIGGRYSPSLARQATLWGIVMAIVVAAAFGLRLLVDELDKPPAQIQKQAPWAQKGAPQKPPKPLQ